MRAALAEALEEIEELRDKAEALKKQLTRPAEHMPEAKLLMSVLGLGPCLVRPARVWPRWRSADGAGEWEDLGTASVARETPAIGRVNISH